MPTALETFTAEVGRHFFLREFSFDRNTFRAACGSEFELADHVIALPDETFVFQIKERCPGAASDPDSIEKWFKQKVLKVGCGQLQDSETFLRTQAALPITNQRGHVFDLAGRTNRIVKILLHSATGEDMPKLISTCRHKVSARAGFVHVLNIADYCHLCNCLAAPRELSEYFQFRERFLTNAIGAPPVEAMLVAMFVSESNAPLPTVEAKRILAATLEDVSTFDLGPILRKYGETFTYHDKRTNALEYYDILREFAQLHRADLRELKGLFAWALRNVDSAEPSVPSRMLGSTKTGFVVFPVHAGAYDMRLNALLNFTTLLKYDWKLERAIGVSFARDQGDIEIDWGLACGPWEADPELDDALATSYPFHSNPEPTRAFRYPG